MKENNKALIKKTIKEIKDFPIHGIKFKDITPLVLNPKVYQVVIDELIKIIKPIKFDAILTAEARGFLFASTVAYLLKKPLVLIRKKDKLPRAKYTVTTKIEYATNTFEMHKEDVKKNQKFLLIDDLLATGGTLKAIHQLVKKAQAKLILAVFIINLLNISNKNNINVKYKSIIDIKE